MVTGVTKLNVTPVTVTPVRFPQNAHFWLLIACIIAHILTWITTGLEIYYDYSNKLNVTATITATWLLLQ